MSEYPLPYRSKKVVLSVTRSTYSEDSLMEVLRFVDGLSGGMVGHRFDVVFIGDGVTDCVAERCTERVKPYFTAAKSYGTSFYADKPSLDLREIKEERLFEGCSVITPKEFSEILKNSELHMRL